MKRPHPFRFRTLHTRHTVIRGGALLLFILTAAMPFYANPADSLRNEMSRVTAGLHATVGVSFIHNGRLFTFNDSVHYPMMSVYKVPVALAVLQKMSSTGTSPATRIEVKREQWHPDTYSPMREAFRDRSTQIRLADLLHYCVAMSDNNAADILTAYVGGITVVARTVEKLIGKKMHISETEQDMHENTENVYNNWCHPSAMAILLQEIYEGNALDSSARAYFERLMRSTQTGTDKMPAGLPPGIALGHKTGSSDRDERGNKAGDNDAGVIYMPDGKRCYAAVFIKDSTESDATNAQTIATLTRLIYRFSNKHQ